ncbi:hypothetical protein [Dactylosporangium sp. CA-139066]|uniref:hypothetical protein n=1 Tax=Dactylosporangium sp. CA-139066 TaxID=3239930 RepID=UPI003D94A03B
MADALAAIGDATVKIAARHDERRWRIAATLTTPEGFALVIYLTAHGFRNPCDIAPTADEAPYRVWLPGSIQDIACATLRDAIAAIARLRGERSLVMAAAPKSWTRPARLIVGKPIRHTRTGRTGMIMGERDSYPIAVRWDDTGKTVYTTSDAIAAR